MRLTGLLIPTALTRLLAPLLATIMSKRAYTEMTDAEEPGRAAKSNMESHNFMCEACLQWHTGGHPWHRDYLQDKYMWLCDPCYKKNNPQGKASDSFKCQACLHWWPGNSNWYRGFLRGQYMWLCEACYNAWVSDYISGVKHGFQVYQYKDQ